MKNTYLFDFDGTLVDSMQYWRNILSEYLQMPVSKEYAEKNNIPLWDGKSFSAKLPEKIITE